MPAYSTDKGFTGSGGGLGSGAKDKDKDKKNKEGGALGMGAARTRANERLSGFAGGLSEEGQKSLTDKAGEGKSTVGPGAGVLPFQRTKVVKGKKAVNPTVGGAAAAALKAATMGPLAAIGTIAGSEEVTGIEGGILGPLGLGTGDVVDTERLESDPSQLGESGLAQSELAPPPAKKKKNIPLGNIVGTLLADAGGTLVSG